MNLPRPGVDNHRIGPPDDPEGRTLAFPARPRFVLRAASFRIDLGVRTQVMAILNATPDSFSDGGRWSAPDRALQRLEEIWREGADWVDLGGESTRPGAEPVDAAEEWARIGPILVAAHRRGFPLPISVDTTKSEVAERALEAGASIINDVSGLCADPRIADLAARTGAGLVLMHMRGDPRTMQADTHYADLLGEIGGALARSVAMARERGVRTEQILIDPGIGFGKDLEQNLELIAGFPRKLLPVVIGASRKAFLGRILGLPPERRVAASVAAHVAAVLAGAHVVRVHDVGPTVEAVRIADEILRVARMTGAADR